MAKQLTPRQADALAEIQRCIADNGYAPSVRELGQTMGIKSPATVHAHLVALEEKGYVQRVGPRAVRIIEGGGKGEGMAGVQIGSGCPGIGGRGHGADNRETG